MLLFAMPLANACGNEDYMGSICLTAAKFCPEGKLEADGRLLQIAQNQQLFQLLGKSYGGDGVKTFALPDLRGRAPVGRVIGAVPAGVENILLGRPAGQSSTLLRIDQLPPHTHPFNPAGQSASVSAKLLASTATAKSDRPSAVNRFLAPVSGEDSGSGGIAAMYWTDAPTPSVEVGGLNVSIVGGGNGAVGTTGGGLSVPTQSPALGMTYCIESRGQYPPGG